MAFVMAVTCKSLRINGRLPRLPGSGFAYQQRPSGNSYNIKRQQSFACQSPIFAVCFGFQTAFINVHLIFLRSSLNPPSRQRPLRIQHPDFMSGIISLTSYRLLSHVSRLMSHVLSRKAIWIAFPSLQGAQWLRH